MEQSQKLTFASIFYQNVAGLSADDFPGHRITLQAEDETSCSTSHWNEFFFEIPWHLRKFLEISRKIDENKIFSHFSFFSAPMRKLCPDFSPSYNL